jgi:hypothetical protein
MDPLDPLKGFEGGPMLRRALVLLALLSAAVGPVAAQGTLSRLQADPPPQPPAPPAPKNSASSDTSSTNWGTGGDPEGTGYLLVAAAVGATSPIWLPWCILDDHPLEAGYFPPFPYPDSERGYLKIDRKGWGCPTEQDCGCRDPEYLKVWAVRLSVEEGNDFRGLNRVAGRLTVDTAWRIGLETNWNWLHESLDGGGRADAVLGDANLTWRFAQNEWVQMHTGGGFRVLDGGQRTRWGFNFLYGADVFPLDPLVISAQVDLGSLGDSFVVRVRGSVGVVYRSLEVFTGYDFQRIGDVNVQGPMAGIRLWF